jgi:hypothetical protein
VYFLQGGSIIAADYFCAADDTEAAELATQAVSSYSWANSLIPDSLEVWHGQNLRHSRPMSRKRQPA